MSRYDWHTVGVIAGILVFAGLIVVVLGGHLNELDGRCKDKGGIMVKSLDGWVCIDAKRLL